MNKYNSLTNYLNSNNINIIEGYTKEVPLQYEIIKNIILMNKDKINNILEIGFNAGHSSELFLKNTNQNCKIISFDLGEYDFGKVSKKYIDFTYPFRHQLILGDSTKTIPEFIELSNYQPKFDVIFIDGGHTYEIAKEDFYNCQKLAHKDTILLFDDVVYNQKLIGQTTIGPTQVWREAYTKNEVIEEGNESFSQGRGMAWGKYNL